MLTSLMLTCWQIQYDDGDQETGAAFQSYSLEQSPEGKQVVKVREFKPGNYMPLAERVEDSKTAPASAPTQSLLDTSVPGDACHPLIFTPCASTLSLPLATVLMR